MKKIFLILSVLLFFSTVYLSTVLTKQWKLDINSVTETKNISILDFEFASGPSLDTVNHLLQKTPALKTAVAKQLKLDFFYIITYTLFFSTLCFYFIITRKNIFRKSFYYFIIVATILMGLFDYLENNILAANNNALCCYESAIKLAFPKFLLVGFVLLSCIYTTASHLFTQKGRFK